MNWPNRTIQGVSYDLRHLHPFTFDVTPQAQGAPTYRVRVTFGLHTFAREWRETDTSDFRVVDGTDLRCFCVDRHRLSLNLPAMITGSAKAHFSQQHAYLVFRNVPECQGPYVAFFTMQRATTRGIDAVMSVVSAYEKPNLPTRLPSIGFATLVAKTAKGEQIRRP
ncbi:hypothetical protein [Mesorhizobium sp. CA4]|uniref:hypothetical protein n=1 Tax=Mesorhizobium sp. CA4 TaxID=588499 RepID=UPI001CD0CDCC|nr:hypothetical protein [Mesorhizobium sp. CA4]MBZ9822369.1 hypothetical protein [Mesorhizobium sp. CA4]